MSNYLLIIILFLSFSATSFAAICDIEGQPTIRKTYSVGNFDKIDIRGKFLLELSQSPSFTLELEAQPGTLQEIRYRTSKRRLKMSPGQCRQGYYIVRLGLPQISEIDLDGDFQVVTKGPLTTPNIKIDVNSIARGRIEFNNKWIDMSMTGDSIIEFVGKTNHLKLSVLGNGSLDASGLKSQTAIVNAWGNGIETINVSDFLRVTAQGNALIQYYGDPLLDVTIRRNAFIRAIAPIENQITTDTGEPVDSN